jgi:hypothetical protein
MNVLVGKYYSVGVEPTTDDKRRKAGSVSRKALIVELTDFVWPG